MAKIAVITQNDNVFDVIRHPFQHTGRDNIKNDSAVEKALTALSGSDTKHG